MPIYQHSDEFISQQLHIALQVWQYLAATGSDYKTRTYRVLKLEDDAHSCALCEVWNYRLAGSFSTCRGCPLYSEERRKKIFCDSFGQPYESWNTLPQSSIYDRSRREYASEIVKQIQHGIFLHNCKRIQKDYSKWTQITSTTTDSFQPSKELPHV